MLIRFTKMQGAGNDFVMLDETRERLNLTPGQYRFLADRHFGVGADQILSVRPAPGEGVDFEYVIHNADGGEVEQCGNGARCFLRFVREQGLTDKDVVRVRTLAGVIEPRMQPDGRVTVDMGAPIFDLARVPFDASGLTPQTVHSWQKWPLALAGSSQSATVLVAVVSMGNPHAVQLVDDIDTAPVLAQGPLIEHHASFPNRVNAGFMQIVDRSHIRLRVFERGTGETLSCGTGACAAVVAGIRRGLLDSTVNVATRGGALVVAWAGE
ncbi:MAG: diaminopimelate epimerase, partial [Polaromonas sp.]|nr:diaminopimelate epimerase [Polaromonas sp.]